MRLKAPTAVLGRLAWLMLFALLCAAPAAARPTRALVGRDSMRRLAVGRPSFRERSVRGSAGLRGGTRDTDTHFNARHFNAYRVGDRDRNRDRNAHAGSAAARARRVSMATPSRALADAATARRVHAWEQEQRSRAAQSAMPAAATAMGAATDSEAQAQQPEARASSEGLGSAPADAASAGSAAAGGASGLLRMKSIEEEAATPVLLPSLYDSRGALVVPPPLYGSREILLHQNQMADRDGLDRVRDDADLLDMRRERKLVALPVNETIQIDERLPENRRYSRPWTADFLSVLARDYYRSFHAPLQVDSAVRTVQVQRRLVRTNGNAAPATGDTASPHLTGEAVDIAKRGLTLAEIAWMRSYLGPLIDAGKIDVEEEFQQACFHISVYRSYTPAAATRVTVAAAGPAAAESLP